MPNKHLHPQLEVPKKQDPAFIKGHRRSTSHHNLRKDMSTWGTVDLGLGVEPDRTMPVRDTREVGTMIWLSFKRLETYFRLRWETYFTALSSKWATFDIYVGITVNNL